MTAPGLIRGMRYALDQIWMERDTYVPTCASWTALDNAAKRLARRIERFEAGNNDHAFPEVK